MILYYGNGSCTIEGSNVRGVQIRYKGAIEIHDKTSNSFAIAHQKNGIMIFPIGEGTLNDLFSYRGEFRILSAIVADINGEKVPTSIRRVMDYTELLNANSEDMTTNSEDLSSTYTSGGKVAKTTLKQLYIPNLNTSTHNAGLYFKDGTKYDGSFHIHLDDGAAMTGNRYTKESQDLYLSTGNPTRNKGMSYSTPEYRKRKKAWERKVRATKKIRKKNLRKDRRR